MKDKQLYISVIGASVCNQEIANLAYEVGKEISQRGHILVCGGLSGVMDASAKGAFETGGLTVGILPGESRLDASAYLTVSIPTSMSYGRNFLVAMAGDSIIAVGGEFGTLSEISFGLKLGRPVVLLKSWELEKLEVKNPNLMRAKTPQEAVRLAEKYGAP